MNQRFKNKPTTTKNTYWYLFFFLNLYFLYLFVLFTPCYWLFIRVFTWIGNFCSSLHRKETINLKVGSCSSTRGQRDADVFFLWAQLTQNYLQNHKKKIILLVNNVCLYPSSFSLRVGFLSWKSPFILRSIHLDNIGNFSCIL